MLDCWMSWTERYTLEMAEMLAPYRIYWMEECLEPYDYAGFGRLHAEIKIDAHSKRGTRVRPLRIPQFSRAQRPRNLAT